MDADDETTWTPPGRSRPRCCIPSRATWTVGMVVSTGKRVGAAPSLGLVPALHLLTVSAD